MKNSQDKEGWLEVAKKTYAKDNEVARQLLRHYYINDSGSFIELSRELFEKEKSVWAFFLQNYVSPKTDKELYIDVFWELTVNNTDLAFYKKLRNLLSETQKNTLIEQVSWNKPFVTQILNIEERYEEIKEMVEQSYSPWEFSQIIAPVLGIYPEFCFIKITKMAYKALENNRSRSTYQTICNWLILSQKIPGFINEKQELISQLYHHRPNLPALKDELKRAGLVN